MPDYSIEKYIISNNRTLGYDDFYDFDRVKVAFIESDFDMDDDSANHFLCMKDLERFDVLDEKSRFYTEEGVLFVNVGRKHEDRIRSKEMFFDFPEGLAGKVLVAFPTNYTKKKYSIPEGTVAICKGAFEGTNIEELTIPDSIQYIDLHALENTDHLSILRVPNKLIEIWDHWQIGKKDGFIITCNDDNCSLTEEVIGMWHYLTAPMRVSELSDDVLGKGFCGEHETFGRVITWPEEETKMKALINDKESVFAFYSKNKNKKDRKIRNMLALIFYMVKPCILHPTSEAEAKILLDMMFGHEDIDSSWLKKYSGSPRDYRLINRLYQTDLVSFFHYMSNRMIHKLFLERSAQILRTLSDRYDTMAITNLLAIIDDNHAFYRNDDTIQKAIKVHEPISMWDLARHLFKWGGERTQKAMELFQELAFSEDILPHPYVEKIKKMALNNYMWLNSQDDLEGAVKAFRDPNTPSMELPF